MFNRPRSNTLAMRSPAQAALLGVFADGDFGADFGGFGGFGDDYGTGLANKDVDQGHWRNAAELRHDRGVIRSDQRKIGTWIHEERAQAARAQREQARCDQLDPNEGLSMKIGRYSFTLNQALIIGTLAAISMTLQPDTRIRPQRVLFNAPCFAFATISTIKVANVSVLVGGSEDAFMYTNVAVGVHLDMPTLSPSNRATVVGSYGALAPAPYSIGFAYPFTATFQGPSTQTGEG